MSRQDELRKILEDIYWKGTRGEFGKVDQAISAIHALDTDQNILCKECEHRKHVEDKLGMVLGRKEIEEAVSNTKKWFVGESIPDCVATLVDLAQAHLDGSLYASHTATVAGKDREIAWLKDEIQLITAPIESTGKAMLEKDKRIIELRARVKELQSVHDSELGVCEQHCDVVKDLKDYIEDLKAEIAKLSNSAQFRRCEEQQKEIAMLREALEKIASYQYPQHHCVEIAKKARGDGR